MGRSPGCWRYLKHEEGIKRGAWTPSEDKILIEYIKTHGIGRWRDLPQKAGLRRCAKSCRLHWLNYLRPDIKRGNISPEEDELLGNRWTLIAGRLPGRTENEIKNYWNTQLSKRVQKGEFDPKYQEPFKERAIPSPSIYDKGVLHKDDYSYDIIVDGDNLDSYDHDCVPDTHDRINQEGGLKGTNHHVAEIDTSKSWCQLLLEDCMGDYQYDRLEEISGLHPNNMTNGSNVIDDQHQPQSPFVSQSIILQENHFSSCDLIQQESPHSKDFISSYFGSFLDLGEQAILLP